jgi:hypothetical protein
VNGIDVPESKVERINTAVPTPLRKTKTAGIETRSIVDTRNALKSVQSDKIVRV